MSTTITGKMNKDATEFQAGESTGFGVRIGKQYYDRETKQKEWTNYEAVIFAKAPAQVDFYRSALVAGSVIELAADAEKIKKFEGTNGLSLSIELIDVKLGFVDTKEKSQNGQGAPQRAPQAAPQAPQAAPQQPAPSNMGYYYEDGQVMTSEHANWYRDAGHLPWAKGTKPPA